VYRFITDVEAMMTKTAGYEDLIDRYGISMEIRRVGTSPGPTFEAAGQSRGLRHYRCNLRRPGKSIELYFSAGASDGALTLSDVLHMLAMDSSACRMLEGYEETCLEWASEFSDSSENLAEFEAFWQEYKWRCKQTSRLRDFLGDAAYEQLVQRIDPGDGFPVELLASQASSYQSLASR
jgi:hypothetical protein